jgi:hypothetical protein
MAVQVVHSGGGPVSVNVTTTPAISVTSPQVNVVDVNPVYTSGQPGNTGPQGPQGPAGANGADGVTVTYTLSAQDGANSDEEKVRITGSNGTSSEVVLEAGTNLSIARSSDKITFASTVTNAVLESDTSTSGFGFVVDEDDMSSNLNTKVPTQQSVKAYVDNNVTTANVTTNLATSYQTDRVTVTSSDGTDAVILEATGSQAGVMTVAMHDKLDGIASNADATNSTNVNAAGAIMHSDVAGSATGLITRADSEQYTVVAASTSNISEGSNLYYTDARADARVSAVIDTDNTLGSPSDTLVPSQAAIKTYVDNQLGTQNLSLGTKTGTTVAINISGGGSSVTLPASTTSEAGLMTEAQFDKLAGIEANADVTDTANVTAAGALMDSEVTNLAQVKAFDSSDYATAAQGTKADNALPKAGGTMTGNITFSGTQTVDGRDLSADGAKLDNIEANADVTDTANVTSAGALMDSEVTNLAQVKAFDSSDYATSTQGTTADNALPKSGGQMTGNITFSGSQTVDGRDLSADGAKLDGIEANATADQTDAEIRSKFSAGTGISYSSSTGVIASTVSNTNTQNTTTLSFQDSGDDIVLRNTTGGAGSGNQDININAGSNITLTHTDSNNITIAATTNVTGLSAVVQDTSPSLGGNLNVNGNSLISPTNGDILVNPNGTGKFRVEHDSEVAIRSTKDAGVELFHNNAKKFETLSTGINVSGTADISGYVNPTGSNSGVRINAGQTLGASGLHSGAEILDSFFASASLIAGKLYYAGSSAWALADKDAEGTASGLLGIATDNANANEMVVKGVVRVATLSGSSPAKGDIVYVGDDGNPTTDAPSSDGDIVRIIGYVVTAGQSRTIYFNPSPDFIEIA